MNGEGQRPPAPPESERADAPEPGNSKYPQPGQNGQYNGQPQGQGGSGGGQGQQGEGGRRRFRRQRRGGRGRRGKGGRQHGQGQGQPPLDAQGPNGDVEN